MGGVLAQLLMAAAVLLVGSVLSDDSGNYFGPIVLFLGYFNIVIAMGNLAPRRGLDVALAWQVFPEIVRRYRGRDTVRDATRRASKRR